MDFDTLYEEAQKLARTGLILNPNETDSVLGYQYDNDSGGPVVALKRGGTWLVVERQGGNVTVREAESPPSDGSALYGLEWTALPPIEALFYLGSEKVQSWLAENGWEKEWGYNDNFKDAAIAQKYINEWIDEHPLYQEDDFAVSGGWPIWWPEDDFEDWEARLKQELVLLTVVGEPWLEVWADGNSYRVFERIT